MKKILIAVGVLSFSLVAAKGIPAKSAPGQDNKKVKVIACHVDTTPLSIAEIHQIEQRIPLLKEGMSALEVREVLGLKRSIPGPVIGAGPMEDYHISHNIRKGYVLTFSYDITQKPSKFKRLELRKVSGNK